MTDNGDTATELAERAAEQGKHAMKNSGRAVKAVAEPVVEAMLSRSITDEIVDRSAAVFALTGTLFFGAMSVKIIRNFIMKPKS